MRFTRITSTRRLQKKSFARRMLVQLLWRVVYRAVCVVVYMDHGSLLRELGVGAAEFWRETGAVFDEVAAKIFCPAHVLVKPEMTPIGA